MHEFTSNNYPIIFDIFYIVYKLIESLKTTVQLLQNLHGMDITYDNVFSSVLSCSFSYLAAALNRASYF